MTASPDTTSLVGRQIGSYKVLSLLGAGGMGVVYRARDGKLSRDVAIKVVSDVFLGDPQRLSRLEREARILATLNHPHIGAIYGLEETDGMRGLVLELVEGDPLAVRLLRGPLELKVALRIARDIADALDAAHDKGIIHRDLKPANVMLTRDEIVKVLDFGIAKADDRATAETALTIANVIQGTPAFIAPEQALGVDLDARADIYSTGCVAFWLLTGELVFKDDTPMKLLMAHANAVPEPPSMRTELTIPAALDALVLSCLAKDPASRPQSARELLERLQQIELNTSWTAERARDWWLRNL